MAKGVLIAAMDFSDVAKEGGPTPDRAKNFENRRAKRAVKLRETGGKRAGLNRN
jgi:hypothetical protein